MPISEGAVELVVAEVIIPDELGDFGLPHDSEGSIGKWFEAEGDARVYAGGDTLEADGSIRCGWGWWSGEGCFFDAGVLPGGHEAG